MSEAKYLNAAEVANVLGVTRQHAYKLLESGAIPSIDVALPTSKKKCLRVNSDELEAWLNRRKTDRRRR